METKIVIKLIDYNFQRESQLTEAHDDSNSLRGLDSNLERYVIGRCGNILSIHQIEDYKVIFLPVAWSMDQVAQYILDELHPDVLHLHGNHVWPSFPYYAKFFRPHVKNMIFSHAATSCGTPEFLSYFDHIIVNHFLQIDRMKCRKEEKYKIIIRKRSADPNIFYPSYSNNPLYDFVFVSGFIPRKFIPTMIDAVSGSLIEEDDSNIINVAYGSGKKLVVLGDFTRTVEGYNNTKAHINSNNMQNRIFLHDFISQSKMFDFLGKCKIFVWPNTRPDNPSTTTNRSVIEALTCGMPLLLGGRAFKDTEFVIDGYNGYLYSNQEDFNVKANSILMKLDEFRENSVMLAKERFSWKINFVDFYNELYFRTG